MFVKLTGIAPEAITPLEMAIKRGEFNASLKTYRDQDSSHTFAGSLVTIVNCKRVEFAGTYTLELKILVKCARAYTQGDGPSEFGEYFTPAAILLKLIPLLSLGHRIQFFPQTGGLIPREKK